jgi:two-component system, OmpR family, sensor histidine kinase TctE
MPDETRPAAEVVGKPQSSGWRANLRALTAVVRHAGRPPRPDEPRRQRFINPLRAPEERHSLFAEILDWMWAPLMVVWPLSVTITFLVAQGIAQAPFDRDLEESLQLIAGSVRESDGRVGLQLSIPPRELVHATESDHVYYTLLGLHGEFIEGDASLPLPPAGTSVTLGTVLFRGDLIAGEEVRVAYTWVQFSRAPAGANPVLVQVAETMERRTQLANEIVRGVVVPQFVILPLAVILVWFGLTRGLAPLVELRERIRTRRPDDLAPIDPKGAPEELEPLLNAFNELLQRMQHNVIAQRRFISEVAHQMKTPLAGLRTQAELALREQDAAQLRRSLRQIAGSTERATHLVNQLLSLARAEHQATDLAAFEPVDLGVLASDVLRDLVPVALARSIDLGLEAETVPQIIGVPLLLREAIRNLVDNAIRYTPDGGTVTARVRGGRGTVLFECEDTGPGIPASERPLVFERFYRGVDTRVEGTGLGLAIVREIVAQHDGLVRLGSNPRATDPDWPGTLISVEFSHLAGGPPTLDLGSAERKPRANSA